MSESIEGRSNRGLIGALRRRPLPYRRIALIIGGLAIVATASRLPISAKALALESQIRQFGPWGPLAFGFVFIVAVVLMVPASALTLAAGALFGPVVGAMTVSVASTIGAAIAFQLARSVARGRVAERVRRDPRLAALDSALRDRGWRLAALMRLSPIVPFNLQNYLYGLTGIGFWTCMLTSWVTMLPGTILYVWLGHAGRMGLDPNSSANRAGWAWEWGGLAVGVLATVTVVAYASRLVRNSMKPFASHLQTLGQGGNAAVPSSVTDPTPSAIAPFAIPERVVRVRGHKAFRLDADHQNQPEFFRSPGERRRGESTSRERNCSTENEPDRPDFSANV